MGELFFFAEDCELPSFLSEERVSRWLETVAADYGFRLGEISFIFCSDPYILDVNRKYLNHDYYTDVITFDYVERDVLSGDVLSGDVFISLDTVQSNSQEYHTTYEEELHRVIVHSVLHLIGYKDKTDEDAMEMRENENHCLELLKTL